MTTPLVIYCGWLAGVPEGSLLAVAALTSAAAAIFAVVYIRGRLRRNLESLVTIVVRGERMKDTGWKEFTDAGETIHEHVERWSELAAGGREMANQMSEIVRHLDRREDQPATRRITKLMPEMRSLLTSHAGQTARQITSFNSQIQHVQAHLAAAETNSSTLHRCLNKIEEHHKSWSKIVDNAVGRVKDRGRATQSRNEIAATCRRTADELQETFDSIRDQAESWSRCFTEVSDRAEEIRNSVATLQEISARTDMLAVNAAIESVRASEHGKGFALVADEIRSLARKATQVTYEALNLTESLQLKSRDSGRELQSTPAIAHGSQLLASVCDELAELMAGCELSDSTDTELSNTLAVLSKSSDDHLAVLEELLAATVAGNDTLRLASEGALECLKSSHAAIRSLEPLRLGQEQPADDRGVRDSIDGSALLDTTSQLVAEVAS